jgi:hypothetical protein
MSEIQAMIQLRHGPPEPTEVFVDSLPQQVVDEWYRYNWPSRRRLPPPAWIRRGLINYLDRAHHQENIAQLLTEYYSSHE